MGIGNHLVAHQAAQQLVDRDVQRLALDVPEGDIDRGERGGYRAFGRKEPSPREGLPEMLDTKRVLTDQQGLEMLDRAGDRQLTAGQTRFADAGDPFVGVDDDEEEVAKPAPDGIAGDIGDAHA